jgi:DNA helicase-2/ATP-dependent DNA helicase PcrA
MELIVDLHIHSHFSRATGKEATIEGIYRWGKIKGINIIGTGDFTHPAWFAEMREKLEPAEGGLYKLKDNIAREIDKNLPSSVSNNLMRYIPTVEISNIYSKNQKVRKLHNLIIAPSFEAVTTLNSRLERIGNLKADGRPILGLDSKELLKISLETDPDNLFIPAHVWTPWFGMFGSKSGFDTIQEAFEELTPHIVAIETGLSSDPFMNWRLSQLHNLTIISNSDAHSPQKLGREATIVDSQLSYEDILGAIRTNDTRLIGTIEFFPEEGKYHYDGHRACNIRLTPQQTKAVNKICPVCNRPLTVGVDYRVEELADHPHGFKPYNHKIVEYIIPLPEIVAELNGIKSTTSKKVIEEYNKAIVSLGSEFNILRKLETDNIKNAGFALLAQAIQKMRAKDVHLEPGYDGVYGTVRLIQT